METKFSQVAHLYLGCEIQDEEKPQGTTAILDSIDTNGDCYYNYYDNETYLSDTDSVMCHVDDIKPILKHLSDITEQDQAFLTELVNNPKPIQFLPIDGNKFTGFNQSATYGFSYLLSKGYDLFHLIETGQSINAKTV